MTEVYLKFTNEKGEEERILVEGEKFVVGRHSDNDLSIVNSKLSRQHIKIERFADVFVVSDLDSSNGTTLNEIDLKDPESLKDGDKLNLGGGLEMEVELISDDPYANNGAGGDAGSMSDAESTASEAAGGGTSANIGGSNAGAASPAGGGAGLGMFFIIAPIIGLSILLILGGAFYFLSDGSGGSEVAQNDDDFIYTSSADDDFLKDIPENLSSDEETLTETNDGTDTTQINNGADTPQTDSSNDSTSPETVNTPQGIETVSTPGETSETDKIRSPALDFMRRIAYEDPRPVLTTKQLEVVNAKIRQYQGSAALAANIKDAKNNAAQIEELARSKNLKPQLLATAALSKLGNQRGNVLAEAQGMAQVLENLSVQIGQGLANDSLILVAVYNQGVAGENLKMRNKLASLSNQNQNISSRQVRTIWFLRDKSELTDQEFELALRFLAIGTITQNPEAFNVKAEALTL